jgi:hypothetical protein
LVLVRKQQKNLDDPRNLLLEGSQFGNRHRKQYPYDETMYFPQNQQ